MENTKNNQSNAELQSFRPESYQMCLTLSSLQLCASGCLVSDVRLGLSTFKYALRLMDIMNSENHKTPGKVVKVVKVIVTSSVKQLFLKGKLVEVVFSKDSEAHLLHVRAFALSRPL